MQNALALLLTLMFFFLPGQLRSEQIHSIQHEATADKHSYPAPGSPEDKAYSEFMHQLNGVFVLLLGILAFLERKTSNSGPLRWGWPLLFLASGTYLMIRSDLESWPIGDRGFIESLQDPMTLQHKIAAAILLLIGLSEF